MEMLLNKIMRFIYQNNDIEEEKSEVIRYGLEIVITKVFFTISIVIIGMIMNCLVESVIFAVAFTLIRQYSGGYHAETKIKCFMLSILTLVAALMIIKLIEYFPVLILPLFVISNISGIYILCQAPVDTLNKRLDEDEIRVYGGRARAITAILLFVAVLLLFLGLNNFVFAVLTGIIMEAYLMLKGQIQNLKSGDKQ